MAVRLLGAALLSILALAMALPMPARGEDAKPAAADEAGFASLFDGKTLEGWTLGDGKAPGAGWVVQEGTLHRENRGGDLYIKGVYENFDLRFEWKIAEGGNSGLKYRVAKYEKGVNGPEYQLLDDDKHADGKANNGTRKTACLYDILQADTKDAIKKPGEWNLTRIVAKGPKVEHWLNGKLVLAYDLESQAYKDGLAKSKFKGWGEYGSKLQGRIFLQDHGDKVWFKNLRIKDLGKA